VNLGGSAGTCFVILRCYLLVEIRFEGENYILVCSIVFVCKFICVLDCKFVLMGRKMRVKFLGDFCRPTEWNWQLITSISELNELNLCNL